jgi:integrase
VHPDVSLVPARGRRDDTHRLLASGGDPSAARQAEKLADANTFKAVALEWLGKRNFAAKTLNKAVWTFNDLLFRQLGAKPVRSITAPDVLAVVRRIEARGKIETAHRTKQRAGQIFRYAIATG